jgi:hypothetical protein
MKHTLLILAVFFLLSSSAKAVQIINLGPDPRSEALADFYNPYALDGYGGLNQSSGGFVIDRPSGNKVYVRKGVGNGYIVDDNSGINTYVRPGLGGYIIDNGSGQNTYIRSR